MGKEENSFGEQIKNYFSYEGRLNRLPYFLRILGFWVAMILLVTIMAVSYIISEFLGILFLLILIAGYIAGLIFLLFQAIKRLHDLDKSGWYLLIRLAGIIPFLGWIIVLGFDLYLLLAEGTRGPNRFGPDPLGRHEYVYNREYQDQYNHPPSEAIDAEYEETDETFYETRE